MKKTYKELETDLDTLRRAAHAVLNVLPDPEPAETELLRKILYGPPDHA